jgi:hypothetical protein
MPDPLPFRVPDIKRAIKVAHDMGLTVTGYKIGADGSIHVQTLEQAESSADAALAAWQRAQNG